MKRKIQEFKPKFDVLERSLSSAIRPSPDDIKKFAEETMEKAGEYINDPKLRCQTVREARKTIKAVKDWEGP